MKQFAQCSNCQKWYVERAVITVDILQGNGMRRTALWCQPCIQEAEQRSGYVDEGVNSEAALASPPDSFLSYGLLQPEEEAGMFGALLLKSMST